jgi:hypothetical protein
MTTVISGTDGVTFPAGGTGNVAGAVVGTTDTQSVSNKTLEAGTLVGAGTSTLAPLDFASGTLVTTPIAGAFEYDGLVPYFTPISTQRGVMPAGQYYRLNSARVGSNATGAQSIFGVGATLSSNTVYAFEGFVMYIKSAGTTSHTVSLGFGGTATVNNAAFSGVSSANVSSSAPINTNVFCGFTQSLAATAYTTGLTNANIWHSVRFWGTVSVNAGGTFIPQYTLSAAPGGAYTVQIGSHINIYPLGASGSNLSVGTWA